MPVWQLVILVWLGLVILLGVGALVAERRGWIKSERLRWAIRRAYRRDQIEPKSLGDDEHQGDEE